MGIIGGYHAARFTKVFANGEHVSTRKIALAVALFFPGIAFSTFFIVNLFIWSTQSSGAVPFSTILALACLWFGLSCPLVLVGAHFGIRKQTIEYPVRTNQIARHVPMQPLYQGTAAACVVGGVLPFAAVFVELFFVLSSLWMHQIYYLFGFLFLVIVILFITCSEVSIVLVYFQICSEDYRWWWRAFAAPAASGGYVLLYAAYYFFTRMDTVGVEAALLFFGYNALVAAAFAAVTGAVGFAASHAFVRTIYSAVKID
jgi:transmembrane 9 superfamily protein 2/4